MEDYRDLYLKKMNRVGVTRRERELKHKQRTFAKYFEDALNREDCLINGVPSQLVFQDHSQSNNKDLSDDKYIIAKNDTDIGVGAYVDWRDTSWLVFTEEQKTIPTHQQLKIKVVNWKIKWKQDNKIFEYGAYVQNQTLYTLGVATSGHHIYVVNGKMMMYVQNNDSTFASLRVGRRVFIGDKVFKIMFADTVSRKGLINLLMEESTITEYDNKELLIADYYGDEDLREETEPVESGAEIIGEETPRISRTYNYKVADEYEVEEWIIESVEASEQPFYVLEKNGISINLQFKDDFRYVGKTCNIIAKLTNGAIISLPVRIIKKF